MLRDLGRACASRPRAVAVLVAVIVTVGLPAAAQGPFEDDDGSVHEANIELLVAAAITQGCEAGLFCPEEPVTRAQMASFLVRALGYVDDGGGNLFQDDGGNTHETSIDRLAAAGITLGCGSGLFCPNDPVTRAQMASFLARAFHYDDLIADPSGPFTDVDGSVHEANINRLAGAGVTQGCAPDRFCPNDPVTRAQMASFLARALKLPWPTDNSAHPELASEGFDLIGGALAVADFNRDGWGDIAIGIPGEDVDGADAAGAVRIIYGTAGGPTGPTHFFTITDFGEAAQDDSRLGSGLAAGDFNDDGYQDLAIGAGNNARVLLAGGGPEGLIPQGAVFEVSMFPDRVTVLAAGQFGNGPADDLAIGLPTRSSAVLLETGEVQVLYGSSSGLGTPVVYQQDTPGVVGVREDYDKFGWSLAAGDLTGDGYDELVVGVPFEDLNATNDETDVGVVHVFYGSDTGLLVDRGTSPELIDQADLGAVNELDDRFGFSLTVGDLTGDGIGDLIISTHAEQLETPSIVADRGNVHVIPGSANGPVGTTAFDVDAVSGSDQILEPSAFLGHRLTFLDGPLPAVVLTRQAPALGIGVYLLRADRLEDLDTPLLEPDYTFETGFTLAAGDIDGDGVPDLVAASTDLPPPDGPSMTYAGGVAVWTGQPDGALQPWPGGLIQ